MEGTKTVHPVCLMPIRPSRFYPVSSLLGRLCSVVALTVGLGGGVGTIGAAAPTFDEVWRPQFHFTAPNTWLNDPNGMVWYDGEYHLFYQNNPFGDKWGHMSWGHAVSRDLTHWEHLPLALAEENGVMIFSGSAVVDWKNTSGFGRDGRPPMVAIYTGHHTGKPLQNQQIAYSNDRGRTWTKYSGNPVLDLSEADFRDPKVFWHEGTRRWVMAVSWPIHRQVRFYASPDLKSWTHLSDFGPAGSTAGIWECPDLFPLEVEGLGHGSKWVLVVNVGSGAPAGGSGTQYFVGEFDGTRFVADTRSTPKASPAWVPEGRILGDFEQGFAGWTATGDAFGEQPATGALEGQQAVDGFQGRALVNSFHHGDAGQGTLTSPEFIVDRDHLSFLIGGGRQPERAFVQLRVEGRAVRSATGADAERLSWRSWNVAEFRGRPARLEVVDRATGGWGHINVDQFLLADAPARNSSEAALWADFGPDFYAAVSWSDVPKRDGRRLWLGWMSNWTYANDVPTSPWRSGMTVARALSLRDTPAGYRLVQRPVRELAALRGAPSRIRGVTLEQAGAWLIGKSFSTGLAELEIELDRLPSKGEVSLAVRHGKTEETRVDLVLGDGLLRVDRTRSGRKDFSKAFTTAHTAPVRIVNGKASLRLLVDRGSIEAFAQGGETAMTELIFPATTGVDFRLVAEDPARRIRVRSLTVWPLRPAPAKISEVR